METLFYRMLLYLIIGVLRLVNIIFRIFGYLAGIEQVTYTGKNNYLTEIFLSNSKVVMVFVFICLIGVVVGAIFTMISLLKSMISTGKKTQSKIFVQYFASIMSMILVFTIVLVGIKAVSTILQMIGDSFNFVNGEGDIGTKIVNSLILAGDPSLSDTPLGVGYSINNGSISDVIEKVIGTFKINAFGFPIEEQRIYGIINYKQLPYLIGLISAGVLCFVSFQAVLQLTVRLYDLIFLMLVMPLPLAAFPLDDGARFKLWKETIISKMLLAFGVIFAVNIYILMISFINNISLPNLDPKIAFKINAIFKVLMIVCGGFTISAGQLLFSRIMGTDAAENRQMGHNFRTALGGLGTSFGLAKGAFGAVFGKKQKGGANKELAAALGALGLGNQDKSIKLGGGLGNRGGLLGGAAKAAGGLGRLLGGNAYKSGMTSLSRNIRNKMKNSKQSFMDKGGLIGMAGHKLGNIKDNLKNPFKNINGVKNQGAANFERSQVRAAKIAARRSNIEKGVK